MIFSSKKQSFVSLLLVVLLIIGHTLAFEFNSNNFRPNHVGNLMGYKGMDNNGTFCCLPDVFSFKTSQVEATFNSSTSSMQRSELNGQMWADYKSGKVRTTAQVKIGGKLTTINTWKFKISPQLTVNYQDNDVSCVCSKSVVDEWQPFCVPKSESTKISKASFGFHDGYLLEDNIPGFNIQNWVFKVSHRQDVCWLLSSTLTIESNANFNEIQYFDNEWLINQDVFKVKPNCPSIEQCLRK